jgi:hypothetical protein
VSSMRILKTSALLPAWENCFDAPETADHGQHQHSQQDELALLDVNVDLGVQHVRTVTHGLD